MQWVETRGIRRNFGVVPVLRGVDARFESGTISLIEGANGAGKTTLLSIIGTTLAPSAGHVWYEPYGRDRVAVRRELGWVSHESQCYADLTARENVEFAARLRGLDGRVAWESQVDRFGLTGLEARRMGELSRGQRQRVALARALAHRPSLLLLDEPWTGLEVKLATRLEEILEEERARGAIVIVVSHDPGVAERLNARRVRLERGRVA
jgi:heme exporter protein A